MAISHTRVRRLAILRFADSHCMHFHHAASVANTTTWFAVRAYVDSPSFASRGAKPGLWTLDSGLDRGLRFRLVSWTSPFTLCEKDRGEWRGWFTKLDLDWILDWRDCRLPTIFWCNNNLLCLLRKSRTCTPCEPNQRARSLTLLWRIVLFYKSQWKWNY